MPTNQFKGFILLLTVVLSFISASTEAQEKHSVSPFPNSEVKLTDSCIKQREMLNTSFLLSLDPDRLLHNFRVNAGIKSDAKPLEGWERPNCGLRGHFTGHYLSAAASLYEKERDAGLHKRISYMVDALAECQQKMGGKYLSAFPEKDFDTLEEQYGGVWAPYYTIHKIMQGLLDAATLTGNKKAYRIVLNMADHVKSRMEKLTPEQIEKILYTAAANPTNESGGMNEVLHNLYAVSKDPAHLKLAFLFDRKWFSRPLAEGRDILSGLHANTHIALVNGFVRRYENTGESYYHDAALNFWDMLVNHHCYVNGTSSGPRPVSTTPASRTSEHWGVADHLSATLSGEIAESCVTHNTQKLSESLFGWDGSAKYADQYQNTFYNAVMALQNGENGRNVYHLPLGSPRKKNFMKENDFKCCSGSGIEAFTHLNSSVYFHDKDQIWVNLYIPSEVSWKEKEVTIRQTGNFPADSKIEFSINSQNPAKFILNLLIPSWATGKTKILVNGKPLKDDLQPVSYAAIERIWNNGDMIELSFDCNFHFKAMPDDRNVVAFYYGPVLLAFLAEKELILKGEAESMLNEMFKEPNEFSFGLKNGGSTFRLLPFYQVREQSYGVYATIRNEY